MTVTRRGFLSRDVKLLQPPETDATAQYYPPGKEWVVRLATGDWYTIITEVTTAANAVRIHHKRNS
jgi:hypothetical protein